MITFDDIARVNSQLKSTGIKKDKDYIMVNERIKAFRMLYPQGYITTRIASLEGKVVIMVAEAGYYDEEGKAILLGTGTAYEKEDSSFINNTSFIENCETSAVGRALGMLALGIDASFASYEEVANAKLNQGKKSSEPAPAPVEEDVAPALNTKLNANASKEVQDYYNEFTKVLRGKLETILVSFKLTDINDVSTAQWKRCLEQQRKWREKHPQD